MGFALLHASRTAVVVNRGSMLSTTSDTLKIWEEPGISVIVCDIVVAWNSCLNPPQKVHKKQACMHGGRAPESREPASCSNVAQSNQSCSCTLKTLVQMRTCFCPLDFFRANFSCCSRYSKVLGNRSAAFYKGGALASACESDLWAVLMFCIVSNFLELFG